MARAVWLAAALLLTAAAALDRWIDATVAPPLEPAVSVEAVDRDGRLLRAWPLADGRWRLRTTRADVDRTYLDLLIAAEDRRFRDHHGVDWLAGARAAWQAARHGRVVSGASTLTMQVARLLERGTTGSPVGKLRQIRLALALERRLSKDAILDLYLTLAPFGGNVEGVRAAALTWFGKDARALSPAEAALLVALPQAPEARRPDRAPDAAKAARDRVLARAALAPRDRDVARAEPAPAARRPMPALAAHEAERARAADPAAAVLRLEVDHAAQSALEALARAASLPEGVTLALMAADLRDGRIRARVGAPDPFDAARHGALDMTRALRSPGSALKPLIYGMGFEAGLIHPATLIEDRPTDFDGWAPRNFDRGFVGAVSARDALTLSLNVPAVAVLRAVGPVALTARLRRAGADPVLPAGAAPGLAVALGGVGLTLQDMLAVYGGIARAELLAPRAAWQVGDILSDQPPPPGAARRTLAWKTGTSYGHRDAWALGWDGRHVVGVWIGRPDGAAMPGVMGAQAAAPLLFAAFERLGPPAPLPPRPADLPDLANAELAPFLRRFGDSAPGPRLAFPPDGARVALGLAAGPGALALKVADGAAPFAWLVDGRPLPADPWDRAAFAPVAEAGFIDITVIDATGASARAQVFVD